METKTENKPAPISYLIPDYLYYPIVAILGIAGVLTLGLDKTGWLIGIVILLLIFVCGVNLGDEWSRTRTTKRKNR